MVRLPLLRAWTALLSLTPGALSNPQQRSTTTTRTATQQPSGTPAARIACNNSPDLCSRTYNNITHMGAHDSAFLRDESTGNSIAGNQYYNATIALSAGIRLLQAQVHLSGSTLQLCHTTCELLDAGPLETWLARIKYWLDANPSDVITLVLVNADNQPASSFGAAFDRSGISTYAFSPSTSGGGNITWPTLQDLITANTRLVTFIASITPTSQYPYLLDEFAHVFETPYNVTSLSSFSCALDRPSTAESATSALSAGLLPLLNHFAYHSITPSLQIPAASTIDTTNSPSTNQTGALGSHARQCMAEWAADDGGGGATGTGTGTGKKVKPVFVLVDFFDRGPAIETADRVNGVVGPVGRVREPARGVSGGGGGAQRERLWRGAWVVLLGGWLGVLVVRGFVVWLFGLGVVRDQRRVDKALFG